jgi:dihydrofolate synthase / folylpolyglutamate synthase
VNLDREVGRIVSAYPGHGPRASLDSVAALRRRLAPREGAPVVAVVGTNGKTATATYLARLLTASGIRTGLYVSPHLTSWTERIRVDDVPCDPQRLIEALASVHEATEASERRTDLRFFDVLTFAAERLLGDAEVTVFEAGIGGRLDAVRLLQPRLVLLTGVALDHAEILGEDLGGILREKLLVAPAGATVLSLPLGRALDELAAGIAAEVGFRLVRVDPRRLEDPTPDLPAYLRSALALAEAGRGHVAAMLGMGPDEESEPAPRGPVDLWLPGRFECGEHRDVPYVLDVAHNEQAWSELARELRFRADDLGNRPLVALVSVAAEKRRGALPEALLSMPRLASAVTTRHTALPAADPGAVASEIRGRGIDVTAVEDVEEATTEAFERARRLGGTVLVFGSTHLVGEVRRGLGLPAPSGAPDAGTALG